MEGVFEEFEGPPEIALPAGHIADQENVEGAITRGIEHGRHLGAAVHRSPGMGRSPDEPGIDQAESAD
jgi:hypothetical protein